MPLKILKINGEVFQMADDPLRRLHDQTRYSENIQAAMRVPSCISLQEQEFEPCADKADENQILLQTPPDTLRLDDSNYWVSLLIL